MNASSAGPTTSTDSTTKLLALNRVQRRVAAIGFFAVAEHGIIGLIVAASIIVDEPGRRGDAIGLLVMATIVSAITYVVMRLILGGRLVSPWIAIAAIAPVVGFIWVV
ncbi:hypothetical protein [Aeromicrobium sp. CF3.5]|uniref:hypothetical protein n=1 Tax=Aeromicrobium sp. CF3.5 TaxID=3373078 RepID=UPI003EE7964C